LLDGIAGSTHTFASSFVSGVGGFPDVTGYLKNSWANKGAVYIQAVLSQIDDEKLRNLFYSFGEQIQKICDLDNQLVAAIAGFFNLPPPKIPADCYKIARSMNKSIRGPIWANEPQYQRLAQPLREAVEIANDIKQEIDNKLQALLSVIQEADPQSVVISYPSSARVPTAVEIDLSDEALNQLADELFGDEAELAPWQLGAREQRAYDLVDGTVGDEDLVRAIQILHLALRYQAAGIQASKAYKELGIKYQALKQERKAIDCYTKAMKVYNPEARLFLWRGELYYKLGEWNKAQHDIKQALNLQSSLGDLFKDEQELAEEYLTELAKIRESD
jgi:tetratricopeptide (TPR) repeat protein